MASNTFSMFHGLGYQSCLPPRQYGMHDPPTILLLEAAWLMPHGIAGVDSRISHDILQTNGKDGEEHVSQTENAVGSLGLFKDLTLSTIHNVFTCITRSEWGPPPGRGQDVDLLHSAVLNRSLLCTCSEYLSCRSTCWFKHF